MKYFPLLYRRHGNRNYLLWVSDEKESVAVDSDGFVLSFGTFALLQEFAERERHHLETEEPVLHDLDWIETLLADGPVNCDAALAVWNLFRDVSASVTKTDHAFKGLDSRFSSIYDKLFWGNNLPSVTPEGKRYLPEWSAGEIDSLGQILNSGLDLFVSVVRQWNPQKIDT